MIKIVIEKKEVDEMISMQAQMEALEAKMEVLEREKKEAEHQVIRLETELGTVADK